jgi:hypothetical protein
MVSAWFFQRALLLSAGIPGLWEEAVRLQAGRRHWVKALSPASRLHHPFLSSTDSESPRHA